MKNKFIFNGILIFIFIFLLCGCSKKESYYGTYVLENEKMYDAGNLIYDKDSNEFTLIFSNDLKYCKDKECISYKYEISSNNLKIDNTLNESLNDSYIIKFDNDKLILKANINNYYYEYTYKLIDK